MKYAEAASSLITWLRSKTQLLALIHGIQEAMKLMKTTLIVITIIQAIITQWTSHFTAYEHLLRLSWVLKELVHQDAEETDPTKQHLCVLGTDITSNQKSLAMIEIINDNAFWSTLTQ